MLSRWVPAIDERFLLISWREGAGEERGFGHRSGNFTAGVPGRGCRCMAAYLPVAVKRRCFETASYIARNSGFPGGMEAQRMVDGLSVMSRRWPCRLPMDVRRAQKAWGSHTYERDEVKSKDVRCPVIGPQSLRAGPALLSKDLANIRISVPPFAPTASTLQTHALPQDKAHTLEHYTPS